ncbi:MAG: porin [Methylophilus sp.]|nr:porin [Methylophilus sp.]
MNFKLKRSILLATTLVASSVVIPNAMAGGTITFGEDKSVTVGLGMRSSYTNKDDGASNGTSNSNDLSLDSMRLYMNASLSKYIKGTFNTEKKSDESVGVIDAIAQFEFMPEFNIWAGRMLPGSDRANLDGPYYLLAWDYPGIVSRYPSKTTGRDDGVAIWGKLFDGALIYNVGAFEGHNVGGKPGAGGNLTTGDELLYAGRIQYDFWTPNGAPAYYTGSTTFGAVDVLSIGVAAQYQKDGSVSTTQVGDYTGWNIDALMEKKLGDSGAVTLEAAYYEYDTDGVITSEDGNAYLAGIGYIFSDKVGWGQFQPYFRYQKFEPDNNIETKQYDYGVNYVIDSFNAKVSATYSKTEVTATPDVDKFVVGLQLQF